MPRLRRSSCAAPGIARRRRGRGFEYRDPEGDRIDDPEVLERIAELAIPPAWREVWICMDPRGHLQATGVDAAGRKQYLYHERWRAHRDRLKFDSMLSFGAALPALRRRVSSDLQVGGTADGRVAADQLTRDRVLACTVRLLDLGGVTIAKALDGAARHGTLDGRGARRATAEDRAQRRWTRGERPRREPLRQSRARARIEAAVIDLLG